MSRKPAGARVTVTAEEVPGVGQGVCEVAKVEILREIKIKSNWTLKGVKNTFMLLVN